MAKTLFLLVGNGGDGSYHINYTFNEEFINKMDAAYECGQLDWESMGCDGDGFHYDTLQVPDECTLESMGVSDCAYNIELETGEDEDE